MKVSRARRVLHWTGPSATLLVALAGSMFAVTSAGCVDNQGKPITGTPDSTAYLAEGPCTAGAIQSCGMTVSVSSGVATCLEAREVCHAGKWGDCGEIGPVSMRKAIVQSITGSPGTLNAMGLATEASVCSGDPCDPTCAQFIDTPDGALEAGDETLTYSDTGGLTNTTVATYEDGGAGPGALSEVGYALEAGYNGPCTSSAQCIVDQHCVIPDGGTVGQCASWNPGDSDPSCSKPGDTVGAVKPQLICNFTDTSDYFGEFAGSVMVARFSKNSTQSPAFVAIASLSQYLQNNSQLTISASYNPQNRFAGKIKVVNFPTSSACALALSIPNENDTSPTWSGNTDPDIPGRKLRFNEMSAPLLVDIDLDGIPEIVAEVGWDGGTAAGTNGYAEMRLMAFSVTVNSTTGAYTAAPYAGWADPNGIHGRAYSTTSPNPTAWPAAPSGCSGSACSFPGAASTYAAIIPTGYSDSGGPVAVDLNNDGIPEIIVNGFVFNNQGRLIANRPNVTSSSSTALKEYWGQNSIIGDFDLNGTNIDYMERQGLYKAVVTNPAPPATGPIQTMSWVQNPIITWPSYAGCTVANTVSATVGPNAGNCITCTDDKGTGSAAAHSYQNNTGTYGGTCTGCDWAGTSVPTSTSTIDTAGSKSGYCYYCDSSHPNLDHNSSGTGECEASCSSGYTYHSLTAPDNPGKCTTCTFTSPAYVATYDSIATDANFGKCYGCPATTDIVPTVGGYTGDCVTACAAGQTYHSCSGSSCVDGTGFPDETCAQACPTGMTYSNSESTALRSTTNANKITSSQGICTVANPCTATNPAWTYATYQTSGTDIGFCDGCPAGSTQIGSPPSATCAGGCTAPAVLQATGTADAGKCVDSTACTSASPAGTYYSGTTNAADAGKCLTCAYGGASTCTSSSCTCNTQCGTGYTAVPSGTYKVSGSNPKCYQCTTSGQVPETTAGTLYSECYDNTCTASNTVIDHSLWNCESCPAFNTASLATANPAGSSPTYTCSGCASGYSNVTVPSGVTSGLPALTATAGSASVAAGSTSVCENCTGSNFMWVGANAGKCYNACTTGTVYFGPSESWINAGDCSSCAHGGSVNIATNNPVVGAGAGQCGQCISPYATDPTSASQCYQCATGTYQTTSTLPNYQKCLGTCGAGNYYWNANLPSGYADAGDCLTCIDPAMYLVLPTGMTCPSTGSSTTTPPTCEPGGSAGTLATPTGTVAISSLWTPGTCGGCPAGAGNPITTGANAGKCITCPSGQNPTVAGTCANGCPAYYNNFNATTNTCSCAVGSAGAGTNNGPIGEPGGAGTQCESCPVGMTYTTAVNYPTASSNGACYTPCTGSSVLNTSTYACEACPYGTLSGSGSGPFTCAGCQSGSTALTSSVTIGATTYTAPGGSNASCEVCATGTYNATNGHCVGACLTGTYYPSLDSCVACPAGLTATSTTTCTGCASGFTQDPLNSALCYQTCSGSSPNFVSSSSAATAVKGDCISNACASVTGYTNTFWSESYGNPSGQTYEDQCVACPSGMTLQTSSSPSATYGKCTGCQSATPTVDPLNSALCYACSSGTLQTSGADSGKCINTTCSTGTWDSSTGKCESCPTGTSSDSNGTCTSGCASPLVTYGSSCRTACPTSPGTWTFETTGPQSGSCVETSLCPTSSTQIYWTAAQPSGFSSPALSTGVCATCTASGTTLDTNSSDSTYGYCIGCPSAEPNLIGSGPTATCTANCTSSQTLESTGTYVGQCVSCGTGTTLTGTTPSWATYSCLSCPTNYSLNTGASAITSACTLSSCPSGQSSVSAGKNAGGCYAPCSSGSYEGNSASPNDGQCVSCPSGYQYYGEGTIGSYTSGTLGVSASTVAWQCLKCTQEGATLVQDTSIYSGSCLTGSGLYTTATPTAPTAVNATITPALTSATSVTPSHNSPTTVNYATKPTTAAMTTQSVTTSAQGATATVTSTPAAQTLTTTATPQSPTAPTNPTVVVSPTTQNYSQSSTSAAPPLIDYNATFSKYNATPTATTAINPVAPFLEPATATAVTGGTGTITSPNRNPVIGASLATAPLTYAIPYNATSTGQPTVTATTWAPYQWSATSATLHPTAAALETAAINPTASTTGLTKTSPLSQPYSQTPTAGTSVIAVVAATTDNGVTYVRSPTVATPAQAAAKYSDEAYSIAPASNQPPTVVKVPTNSVQAYRRDFQALADLGNYGGSSLAYGTPELIWIGEPPNVYNAAAASAAGSSYAGSAQGGSHLYIMALDGTPVFGFPSSISDPSTGITLNYNGTYPYAVGGPWDQFAWMPGAAGDGNTDPAAGGGSITIADYDGDGLPEIGVAGGSYYVVYDLDCITPRTPKDASGNPLIWPATSLKAGASIVGTCQRAATATQPAVINDCGYTYSAAQPSGILWCRGTQDQTSFITGSSVFDFSATGKANVVYADECWLRIYDGATGTLYFSAKHSSETKLESPTVVDVNGDGRADLLMPSTRAGETIPGSGGNCPLVSSDVYFGGADQTTRDSSGNPTGGYLTDKNFPGLPCTQDSDCPSYPTITGQCDTVAQLCRCTTPTFSPGNATPPSGTIVADPQCGADFACIDSESTTHPTTYKYCRALRCVGTGCGVSGVQVYTGPSGGWAKSRSIWNQQAYTPALINEDTTGYTEFGQVPTTSALSTAEKAAWTPLNPGANSFRQQLQPGGYAAGLQVPSLTLEYPCDPGLIPVCNRGSADFLVGASTPIVINVFDDGATGVYTGATDRAPIGQCTINTLSGAVPPIVTTPANDIAPGVCINVPCQYAGSGTMYGSGNYEFWIDAVCQGAECSATNLTPCTSDSNSDGTCNATTGHCNVASCAGLNTLTATPLTPNCTPGSGRSTFDNGSTVPGGICISDYTATPAVFRRLFYADPATACGPGLRAHWSLFTYNYNSGDGPIPKGTNITFDFRTGSDAVSVYTNPAVTVSIAGYSVTTSAASATAVQLGPTYCTNTSGAWPTSPTPCPGGDVTCPVACPIDVGAALHNGTTSPLVLPQQPYLPYLLMEATFNPNSGDFSNTPVLSSWDVTYDCEADM